MNSEPDANDNSYKLTTEESNRGPGTQGLKNDEGKKKRKRLIRTSSVGEKGVTGINKSKSNSNMIVKSTILPNNKQQIIQINTPKLNEKNENKQINNIIININNQISPTNDVKIENQIDKKQNNTNNNSNNNINHIPLQDENFNHKNNNTILEASQEKIFVLLNRLLYSNKCLNIYKFGIMTSLFLTILSLCDLILEYNFIVKIILFILEAIVLLLILGDIIIRAKINVNFIIFNVFRVIHI